MLALTVGGGFDNSVSIPGTESGDSLERLSATFPEVSGASAQIVVSSAGGERVDEGATRAAIEGTIATLQENPEVQQVATFDDEMMPVLVSEDGDTALIMFQLKGDQIDISDEVKDELRATSAALTDSLPGDSAAYLGGALFAAEFPEISITEVLGVLIALVVLVFTLGTFVAAGLPLVTALAAVGASMGLIMLGTAVAVVNATTPLLAVMLGLAVGIDYSLFIVSRHRDQLKQGLPVEESIARSLGTAGSAVVFAGMTVVIALVGLAVAGIPFLTIMGIAGAAAVAVAVVAALTLLPAVLGFAGLKVLTKKERATLAAATATTEPVAATPPNRFFLFWIRTATKRPALTTVAVIVFLSVLALPALGLRLALPDAGVLPLGNQARTAYDLVEEKFGDGFNGPLVVTAPIVTSTDPLGLMADLKGELEQLPGIAEIPLATPNYTADTGMIQVIPTGAPDSVETEDLVHAIRDLRPYLEETYDVEISVTGYTAVGIDVSAKLSDALLPFALVVVGLSLVLLTVVFRSIAVPVTAAAGYLLSVASAFGVVTLVFEWGWLAPMFDVTRLGPVINFMPIVTMGVLFGLSMDYEVFLVSRMREDYVHTGKARESVISGFLGSAKVVTAAAVIMVAVFAAFVPEGDMSIKPIALGLAAGVAIDAFVVRMTLIPAIMVWLGEKAWWIPAWMDRVLPTFDIEGEGILRQRALDGWPAEPRLVAADALAVSDSGTQLSFEMPANTSVAISGTDPETSVFLLALAGRKAPAGGNLKVLGYLLPERSGPVRRRVAYIDARASEGVAAAVARAEKEGAELVVADLAFSREAAEEITGLPPQIPLLVGNYAAEDLPPTRSWHAVALTRPGVTPASVLEEALV